MNVPESIRLLAETERKRLDVEIGKCDDEIAAIEARRNDLYRLREEILPFSVGKWALWMMSEEVAKEAAFFDPVVDEDAPSWRRFCTKTVPGSHGTPRPSHTRPDGVTEFLYTNHNYPRVARRLGIGRDDNSGVWLTIDELRKVQDARPERRLLRGAPRKPPASASS